MVSELKHPKVSAAFTVKMPESWTTYVEFVDPSCQRKVRNPGLVSSISGFSEQTEVSFPSDTGVCEVGNGCEGKLNMVAPGSPATAPLVVL